MGEYQNAFLIGVLTWHNLVFLKRFMYIYRDRSRSVVNLFTQLTGVMIVDKFCAAALPQTSPDTDKTNLTIQYNDHVLKPNLNLGFELDKSDTQNYEINTKM